MAYAEVSDLYDTVMQDKLDALVDDEGDGSMIDARLVEAVDRASAEMDTYISEQYDLPLEEPFPHVLTKIACDIAVYAIFAHAYDDVPVTRRDRYKDAVAMLEQIRTGEISLIKTTGEIPSGAGRVGWYAI
jgi:phage gp36-like protein